MSEPKIRAGKNGCSSEVIFFGRKIYRDWKHGDTDKSELGMKLCTIKWIENRVTDKSKLNEVMDLFSDWQLYENGWYVASHKNPCLWNDLCQIGYNNIKPEALTYIENDVDDDIGK